MKKTMENVTHIEGILYEHNLESKVSGPNSKTPGTPFISGTISIATDDALTNIVQVHFTYVTPTTSKGSANATYTLLQNIIDIVKLIIKRFFELVLFCLTVRLVLSVFVKIAVFGNYIVNVVVHLFCLKLFLLLRSFNLLLFFFVQCSDIIVDKQSDRNCGCHLKNIEENLTEGCADNSLAFEEIQELNKQKVDK